MTIRNEKPVPAQRRRPPLTLRYFCSAPSAYQTPSAELLPIFEGCTTNPQVSAFKRGTEFIRKQNQTWRNRAHGPARQTAMMLLWPCSPADPARFPGTDGNGRRGRWRSPQRSAPRGALHTPGMLCSTSRQTSFAQTLCDGGAACWEGGAMGRGCDGTRVRWENGAMGRGCDGMRVRWEDGAMG